MCVAALGLDAAAAAAVGNSPVQVPPYVAAPQGDNADQLRPVPYGPTSRPRPKAETKGHQLFTGIGGLKPRGVTLERNRQMFKYSDVRRIFSRFGLRSCSRPVHGKSG